MLTATIGRALIQQSIGVTIFHYVSASDLSRRKLNFSVYISFANIANNLRVNYVELFKSVRFNFTAP